MVNEAVISKSLISAINLLVDQRLSSYSFITVAQVESINTNSTIDVRPMVDSIIVDKNNQKLTKPAPVIKNVPYLLCSEPKKGSYCVLLHLDKISTGNKNIVKQIDTNTNTTIKYVKGSTKPHSLNNCVAICGFSADVCSINNK